MPTKLHLALLALAAAALSAHAAGPVNPPAGAVTSTYKTLTEVEPRTPIGPATTPGDADSVYKITQPGSYYLTGDLAGAPGKHGIEVTATNVTIDLGGFTLRGGPGSLSGVFITGSHYTLRNGRIFEWGGRGVLGASNFHIEDIHVFIADGDGIITGSVGVLRGCTVSNAQSGIITGFGITISDCISSNNRSNGFSVGRGTMDGCTATSNGGDGIVGAETLIERCTASYNTRDGFRVALESVVRDCLANANGQGPTVGAGIRIHGTTMRAEGNSVTSNDIGLIAPFGGNLIIRNSAGQNATDYDIAPGNTAGPIVTPATILTNTNPSANYAL